MEQAGTLDGFVDAANAAKGIGLAEVDRLETLLVRTENSLYQITVLQPWTREVVVQGGAFFPGWTRACLSGSSLGGSCLKLGWVGVGFRMEVYADDQLILTSRVQSIALARQYAAPSAQRTM